MALTGYVARAGSLRTGRDVHESLDFAVEEAQFDGDVPQAVTGSVRLNLYVPGSRANFAWESAPEAEDESAEEAAGAAGLRLRTTAAACAPSCARRRTSAIRETWIT